MMRTLVSDNKYYLALLIVLALVVSAALLMALPDVAHAGRTRW